MSYSESPRVPIHYHRCIRCNIEFSCERNCDYHSESTNNGELNHCFCPACWITKKGQDLHWHEWGCWTSYTKEEIKNIETIEVL